MVAGLFDRFPNLKLVFGHLGGGLPFWLYRIDFMHPGIVANDRSPGAQPL
jgi:2,3-dihydroxybenzoate decarboxylase